MCKPAGDRLSGSGMKDKASHQGGMWGDIFTSCYGIWEGEGELLIKEKEKGSIMCCNGPSCSGRGKHVALGS